ncbi:hypothetical protein QVD17_00651 [Tagetes erecta]|uniref:Uncharacterized protein n=1 Tax=Tagetes erecta TaxID=13708 RepID=A0AAD8P7E3_TARER|nr:hypothetical protein QVD17_00651 [Tagetes erecta]
MSFGTWDTVRELLGICGYWFAFGVQRYTFMWYALSNCCRHVVKAGAGCDLLLLEILVLQCKGRVWFVEFF